MKKATRRERRKSDLRARIVSTALELFSKHGFSEVTVEHIADVADVGKGTIYNYFQTKEDIVVAFMVDVERKVQARLKKIIRPDVSLEAILNEFVLFQLRVKQPYYPFVTVLWGKIFNRTKKAFPCFSERQMLGAPPIGAVFKALQESGRIRQDVDVLGLVLAFKTVQLGITGLWAMEGPPFHETEKVVHLQMKLFCEGLAPGPRSLH